MENIINVATNTLPEAMYPFAPSMPYPSMLFFGLGLTVLLILVAWTLIWKGLALWRAARNKQNTWFVILLLVNTLGVLEIIYLLFFSKKKINNKKNN